MTDSVTDFYDRLSPEYRDNMGWDWAGDERSSRNHQFLIGETDGTYEIKHFETQLRILRRHEILAGAADAGYGEVRWHPPESTGYYQPIVTGRNR